MTFTYDPSSDLGTVRLLCTDTDVANPIFSDEEITAFLTLQGGSVRYAAASALDCIATSHVLVMKVIRLLDLTTDGAKVAVALRTQAQALREEDDQDGSFDIAEQVLDPFSARDRLWKEWQRSGL